MGTGICQFLETLSIRYMEILQTVVRGARGGTTRTRTFTGMIRVLTWMSFDISQFYSELNLIAENLV